MSLLVFLVITIILCSLILLVQAGDARMVQVIAVVSIALEVLYLLLVRDVIDTSFSFRLCIGIPCVTGIVGLVGIFKMQERSTPMLIFFTSLIQFFVETRVIDQLH